MRTAAVGVDRPAERHAGRLGYPVDDAPGMHLEERHALESRGVERPGDRTALEQCWRGVGGRTPGRGGLARSAGVDPDAVPSHGATIELSFDKGKHQFDAVSWLWLREPGLPATETRRHKANGG